MTTTIDREFIPQTVEGYQLGRINDVAIVSPEQMGMTPDEAPAAIYELSVDDPYVSRYSPPTRDEVLATEQAINNFAERRRLLGFWDRHPGQAYTDDDNVTHEKLNWGDPVTRAYLGDRIHDPAIDAWTTLVPHATALAYLSDPTAHELIIAKDGTVAPVTEQTEKWLSLSTDAVGIRSRATLLAEVVKQFITEQQTKQGESLGNFSWMSIACGTALPTMKAAIHAGISPDLTLVDIDRSALSSTQALAGKIGFGGEITQERMNIFSAKAMAGFREKLQAAGKLPMLIDMMGIFEYTGENLKVDPIEFLKSSYDLLQEGGKLIFGQMRSDRPMGDFTMGAVGWPFVETRTPQEFMQVISKAGIDPKNVKLYMAKDGVYTVGTIDKPVAA